MPEWKVGEQFTVEITGLSHEGAGVGRVDGRVVFIPGSLPGDMIRMALTEVKRRFAQGRLLEIIIASPQRIAPGCAQAPSCGGCQLQHLDYKAQLEWKRQLIQDAMQRIGGLDVPVLPTRGMDNPYFYRNKSQLPVGRQGDQAALGFFIKGSHEIVDLAECQIQHPLITKLALAVKEAVIDLKIEPYEWAGQSGTLRHVVIRASFAENKLMLILVTRTNELPRQEELVSRLTAEVPELVSIVHNVNHQAASIVLGRKTAVIWGESYLTETIGQLKYAISPQSFFQINSIQTKVLYDLVQRKMALTGTETILDLYCGAGTIGLYLAQNARKVIGVEAVAAAVRDARRNAELNGIDNARFIHGRAEEEVPKLISRYQVDAVVVDPPRQGCDGAVLQTLLAARIPKIVYVSCNPATLARDLAVLSQGGYMVGKIQPLDMFPWTSHVECTVLMSLGDR